MNKQGWIYKKIDLKGLGERIKELRGNESQDSFAEKFGVSQADISRLERGSVINPSPELLFNICINSHVDLIWLLTGEAVKKEPAEMKEERGLPGLSTLERVYVDRLLEILRTKDQGTVSAITQNIDTFLRVPTDKPPLEEVNKKKA